MVKRTVSTSTVAPNPTVFPTTWSKSLLMAPRDVPPSRDDWEVIGVFNPGVAVVEGSISGWRLAIDDLFG